MAIAKKAAKAETPAEETKQETPGEEPVTQEPATQPETEAPKPETEAPKPEPEKGASATMVKVKNTAKTYLRQTSTGIRVDPGEIAEVKDDSWVELQERAKLLERV